MFTWFQLYLDLQEIDKLESITERPRLQKLLALEKGRIQDEIYALAKPAVTIQNEATKSPPKPKIPTVKITSYGMKCSKYYHANLLLLWLFLLLNFMLNLLISLCINVSGQKAALVVEPSIWEPKWKVVAIKCADVVSFSKLTPK